MYLLSFRSSFSPLPNSSPPPLLPLITSLLLFFLPLSHAVIGIVKLKVKEMQINIEAPSALGLSSSSFPLSASSFHFLPTHKLRPYPKKKNRSVGVLVFYGSFAPIHLGHLEALSIAKRYVEKELGVEILGEYLSPLWKLRHKSGVFPQIMHWRERAAITELLLRYIYPFSPLPPPLPPPSPLPLSSFILLSCSGIIQVPVSILSGVLWVSMSRPSSITPPTMLLIALGKVSHQFLSPSPPSSSSPSSSSFSSHSSTYLPISSSSSLKTTC